MSSTPDGHGEVNAFLGKGARFEGRLKFEGTVRIDGDFKGQISTDGTLVVGETGHVEAELEVGALVAHGEIIGDVRAARAVTLHAPTRLKGQITTPALTMDPGVVFDGAVKMTPMQAPVAPVAPAPVAAPVDDIQPV
ncbi:MAG: cytoskeletal protein CcmA (bactofilin family) [Myxococcota bacterium]|jgi:cytoskeletal protein CcmA (bactofilin family)